MKTTGNICGTMVTISERTTDKNSRPRRCGLVFLAIVAVLLVCNISTSGQTATNYAWANYAGQPGSDVGSTDGTGSAARFNYPTGVAVDSAGNVYVADYDNHTIRKVSAVGTNWVVTTLAGSAGVSGSADGTNSAAQFNYPAGVAVDSAGNVYVADYYNSTIRKVSAAGVVTTLAGSAGVVGSADGTGSAAQFKYPFDVAVDSAGNVYVADSFNSTIRKVSAVGTNWVVTTLAGSAGNGGSADGTNSAARFDYPASVAVDTNGNVYVADRDNNTIRKVSAVGTNWVVTTLAGSAGGEGSADGTNGAAQFWGPSGVAVDTNGNVYVADLFNGTIRKVSPVGAVTTLAGSATAVPGSADGTGSAAQFRRPIGAAVDSAGNVFVADQGNNTIRKVSAAGVVTTLAGSAGVWGSADGTNNAARFNYPAGVAVDTNGNVYVADHGNNTIRKVTPVGTNWVVTTLAGSAGVSGSADGTNSAARFNQPTGVAVDSAGNVYVADTFNQTIRKVTPVGTNWVVTTWPYRAKLSQFPNGVAVDNAGNVYVGVADGTIQEVSPWVVTTVAGSAGVSGSADGTNSSAQFYSYSFMAVDSAGTLYVADTGNDTIRKVIEVGTNWVVTTIGGVARVNGGADGIGSSAEFAGPSGIAVDSTGNLYVADTGNNRITKGTPLLTITTPSGLPSGMVGTVYNQMLTAIGGTTPYIWSVVSNSLPTGLTLVASSGAITGTPTVATTANFTVRVTGADSLFTEQDFSLTITTCIYTLSATSTNVAAGASDGSIGVTAGTGCGWTATSNAGWITVTSGNSGTGNGTVGYSVAQNPTGNARTNTLTIAGQTFTVTQSGCSYSITPSSASRPATGGTGTVSVSTTGSCPWTATPNAGWLSITSGSSGSGSGPVGYAVMANGSALSRTGTVTVAGQTFTVTQDGNAAPQVSISSVAPITLPVTTVNLNATVTDDGAPNGILNGTWSKVSGPGTVGFGNAGMFNTTATFSTNGMYWLQLVASDGALTGTGTVSVVVNARPVVVTPPAVSNAVANVDGVPVVMPMESFTFTAAATDADGNALSCFWSFGDGVNSVDCQPSHVFSNCGPHTVTYVVTDGISPVTNTLLVAVACPFEQLPKPVNLTMKVNFVTNKLDTASLKGVIDLPVGVATTNIAAQLSIGSVDVPFSLDRKGRGLNGYSSLKVTRKGKPVLSNQLWQVTGKFKGDFDAVWVGDGLANTNVLNQPITVPVLLLLDSDPPESFYIEKPLLYKAKRGKSGSAK